MSGEAPPTVYDVVLIVESSPTLTRNLDELKENYLLPAIQQFHGGPPGDIDYGYNFGCSLYGLVQYAGPTSYPDPPALCYTPTSSPKKLLEQLSAVEPVTGGGEATCLNPDALAIALNVFEELRMGRQAQLTVERHCILLCDRDMTLTPCQEEPYVGFNIDQLLEKLQDADVHLSIMAPRKLPQLYKIFTKKMNENQIKSMKNYAVSSRNMVLLSGFQLQERPVSPKVEDTVQTVIPTPVIPTPNPAPTSSGNVPTMAPRPAPPEVFKPPVQPQPAMSGEGRVVWSGILEWTDKNKGAGENRITRSLQCSMLLQQGDQEINTTKWPAKLPMQLLPQNLLQPLQTMFRNSRTVVIRFNSQDPEATKALYSNMNMGFAGCINIAATFQSEVRIILLLYSQRKSQFMGLIPANQTQFIQSIKKLYTQRHMAQSMGQGGAMGQQPGAMGQGQPAGMVQGGPGMGPMGQQMMASHMQQGGVPKSMQGMSMEEQMLKMQHQQQQAGGPTFTSSAGPGQGMVHMMGGQDNQLSTQAPMLGSQAPMQGQTQLAGQMPMGGQVQMGSQGMGAQPGMGAQQGMAGQQMDQAGRPMPQTMHMTQQGSGTSQHQLRHMLMAQQQQQRQMMMQQQQGMMQRQGMMRSYNTPDEFTFDG